MASLKRVRVIKKVQHAGVWLFVSLKQNGSRYLINERGVLIKNPCARFRGARRPV